MDKITLLNMLNTDYKNIHNESMDILDTHKKLEEQSRNYMEGLIEQITSGAGLLLAKTPKVSKKRHNRIKAIPENSEMETDNSSSLSISNTSLQMDTTEVLENRPSRAKRGASIKASDNIKKQQKLTLIAKLRRPSNNDNDLSSVNKVNGNRTKRLKDESSSDDDSNSRPVKQSKIVKKSKKNTVSDESCEEVNDSVLTNKEVVSLGTKHKTSLKRKLEDEDIDATLVSKKSTKQNTESSNEPAIKKPNTDNTNSNLQKSMKDSKYMSALERISEASTSSKEVEIKMDRTTRASVINAQSKKTNNNINETVNTSNNANETLASVYEDVKQIMNSTMNPNSTMVLEKMDNAVVLLEPLFHSKAMNETVTIKAANTTIVKGKIIDKNVTRIVTRATNSYVPVQNIKVKDSTIVKETLSNQYNDLISEDESSPERKEYKARKEKNQTQTKRITRSNASLISEDDEILLTPPIKEYQNNKFMGSGLKHPNNHRALFSPYAKNSVKKRVEAFEQVAVSPKQIESEIGGRVTRTKTRALVAASFMETPSNSMSQKLARKSLAKAKKISLAKHAKDRDEMKENECVNVKVTSGQNFVEAPTQKLQSKTTPMGKNRVIPMPSSISKNYYTTPSNSQALNNYSKSLTGTRNNIVTNVESFIQPIKSASKHQDKLAEEKRRRANEEDARRKREELLKAQAEEKKRKREEKELKNRLAREAKEKLNMEKRLKVEKEREEKAKLAQLMLEKQKEEVEKKRIAQLQRAQEKEERRKQEEQLRLQRQQEQEEQEKLLAEQKRREQEMEKRKQLVELKMKSQMEKATMKAKAKALQQKHVPINYKIDSDPDEEESDDENKPKHKIPDWATKNVRQMQLSMQQFIPMKHVLRYFDARKCTPDLRELFNGIDPKKLKRSSSAIWRSPPRYSMMNQSIIGD